MSYPRSTASELAAALPALHVGLELGVLGGSALLVAVVEAVRARSLRLMLPAPVRVVAWAALCASLLILAVQDHSPFIYFQF